jgi:hypothetical protein
MPMEYDLDVRVVRGKASGPVRDLIIRHHYLHSVPSAEFAFAVTLQGKEDALVVWEEIVGGVFFGGGSNRFLGSPYGLNHNGVTELVRLFLVDDVRRYVSNAASRVLSMTLKYLRNHTDKHLAVAFSDPVAGHDGGVYKASNWTWIGASDPKKVVRMDGVLIEDRTAYEILGDTKQDTLRDVSARTGMEIKKVEVPGKLRYAYVVSCDRREKKRLDLLINQLCQTHEEKSSRRNANETSSETKPSTTRGGCTTDVALSQTAG